MHLPTPEFLWARYDDPGIIQKDESDVGVVVQHLPSQNTIPADFLFSLFDMDRYGLLLFMPLCENLHRYLKLLQLLWFAEGARESWLNRQFHHIMWLPDSLRVSDRYFRER